MARKPPKGKSLARVNPELAKQWHSTKNGDLTPFDVSPGANVKVWWKCDKGDDHEWEAIISGRNRGSNCGVCSGRKVVKSNCLATINPELAKEWHPKMNGDLTAYDVTVFSNKKVWWKCNEGDDHEWLSSIGGRHQGRGCSICAGQKIVKSNCLATIHPELTKEWHPTKNGKLTASDVTASSSKKVWWKCNKGDDHEWLVTVNNRTSNNRSCPVCVGQKIVKSNCLATTHKELAKEWHPTKNFGLTPFNVIHGSNKEVWWKCNKGDDHEWKASINDRSQGNGCAVCRGFLAVKSNCLATTHPKLAKEWHPTKNGSITPNDITQGSGKMIWWLCMNDSSHFWDSSVGNRTAGKGCPSCAEYGFNRSKDALFYIRRINLDNGKDALKIGITNNMDGDREKQQSRHVKGSVKTILREEVSGELALDIERLCKRFFGIKGFLTHEEFPDGYTETIKYSEESINKIKSIVDEVLTQKAEKNP